MMLGRSNVGTIGDRLFVYEVSGLRQSDMTSQDNTSIRTSSNVMMPVPFSRMNEFMQRINRLGGTIVAIHNGSPSSEAVSNGDDA